jgi:hypothetical protein
MFRNPQTLTNGLEKVYKGEFEQDPAADYLVEVVDKYNYNAEIIDDSLGEVAALQAQLAILSSLGILDGFLNGGVCGPRPIEEVETTQTISRLYVTPLDYSGDLPVIGSLVPDPQTGAIPNIISLYTSLDVEEE